MPRVMTVDDSRSVRSIIAKQLAALKCDVEEAEDGKQALEKLQDIAVDLILLDVTMPEMDGPTMLSHLRKGGNRTPVIMLTSESKRSIVSEAIKLGIDDYILKPFKPEELSEKVRKALKLAASAGSEEAQVMVASPTTPNDPVTDAKQFIDVLVVDDMENVAKRLRSLLPTHITLQAVTSAQAALASARDRVCRVVLIDFDLPDVNSGLLATQLRLLQPHAAIVALALKPENPPALLAEAKTRGFSDILYKPFHTEAVDDFVLQFFDRQDLLTREDNVLRVAPYVGKPERMDRYFLRLERLLPDALETIASACFEDVIMDLSNASTHPDKLPRFIAGVAGKAHDFGLSLRVSGTQAVKDLLGGFEETKNLPFFADLSAAKAA